MGWFFLYLILGFIGWELFNISDKLSIILVELRYLNDERENNAENVDSAD